MLRLEIMLIMFLVWMNIYSRREVNYRKFASKNRCGCYSGERHVRASQIAQEVTIQGDRRITWRDRLDDVLLHPVGGYLALIAILFIFFQFVYAFGSVLEGPLLYFFDQFTPGINALLGANTILSSLTGWSFAGNFRGGGDCFALPGAISSRTGIDGRYRLFAQGSVLDGCIDASHRAAWQGDRAFHPRLWL